MKIGNANIIITSLFRQRGRFYICRSRCVFLQCNKIDASSDDFISGRRGRRPLREKRGCGGESGDCAGRLPRRLRLLAMTTWETRVRSLGPSGMPVHTVCCCSSSVIPSEVEGSVTKKKRTDSSTPLLRRSAQNDRFFLNMGQWFKTGVFICSIVLCSSANI